MKKTLPGSIITSILIFLGSFLASSSCAQVQTGKSYVNVTKGASGGTFEPGDTLEIRAAISVKGSSITSVRYNDTINSNFTYIAGSLKILTNEGLTFRAYTDAASDDAAMFDGTNKNLRINLGSTATSATSTGNAAATGGTIAATNKPSFYGSVCIMVASFRVKVNPSLAYNTMLTLPGGAFRYTLSSTATIVSFPANKIMLFENLGKCTNFVGSNALIENGGSFGSGTTQNRSASAIVPGYTFINFATGQPNDGYYGIANNTSASGATNNAVPQSHSSRVFSVWDIIGDHTGAASPTAGNTAKAPGTLGGYMAVVNASYATSPAIQQPVTNLCTNTYYDFSAWFRNICSLCACDSNGNGSGGASFNGPYKPGVKPNLTFQLNGIDYYTTGDLPYSGLWEKKGFTYLTGGSETGFTLTIRNNSPGGGGNDWAVDDVSLSTCEPNVDLNITPTLMGCDGTIVDFNVKVKCYFPNYIYYKWQKSINGGSTWLDTGVEGTGSPSLVSGQWEYSATYPTFTAHLTDSGQRYRVVVATSDDNLSGLSCSYSNNQSTMLKIMDCGAILDVQLTNFSGQRVNKKTVLKWETKAESNLSHYEIERSDDGTKFSKAGSASAWNTSSVSFYDFTDPVDITAGVYYRIKTIGKGAQFKYSNTIFINNKNTGFAINSITNPSRQSVSIGYTLPADGKVECRLFDSHGKLFYETTLRGRKGASVLKLEPLINLPVGIYTATMFFENESISKRVIKVN